ncbi:MAG: hypothetical protein RLZZ352_31 [Pseudomonadota bacterium]|jgi:diguanylate cyclase (GGDEF)-like protein
MRFLSSIHIAIGLLLVAFGVGFYADAKGTQLQKKSTRIQLGLERMLRLNQSLTHTMTMTVREKNSLLAASYPSQLAELQAVQQDVLEQTQGMKLASDMQALHQDHQALRAVETEVFELMRQDLWPQAHQVLQARDYSMALKLYEISSEGAVGALTMELNHTTQHHHQLRQMTLVLRAAALLLLLWAGWRYSRRLQTELAEQTRLRTALALSNAELEHKVQQRTQALEALNRQLEVMSTTDSLTQLANRRHFDAVLAEEWQRAQRLQTPLGLILLDIDHFKAYNDHLGHLQGDECLRQIGAVLRASVRRAGELVARYGGEEFVVITPGSNREQTRALAESIRKNIEAAGIPHPHSSVAQHITSSAGTACKTPRLHDTPQALMQAADAALYQAKQQGRNQVV